MGDHAGALFSAGPAGDTAHHRNRISGANDLTTRFIADHVRRLCDGVVLVFCPGVDSVVPDRPECDQVGAGVVSAIIFLITN